MAVEFPLLTVQQLRDLNQESRALFVQSRMSEDPMQFRQLYKRFEGATRRFLDETACLTLIESELIHKSIDMQDVARFFCTPPISQDDLSTLIDRPPNNKKLNAEQAVRAVEVLNATVNRDLCPWLSGNRPPTDAEIDAATASAATFMAIERFRTDRRNESSTKQEADDAIKLIEIGLQKVVVQSGRLADLDAMPNGSFAKETNIAGKKCDIPVKLWDGRLLALECKVSNSERNGWKRLKSEVVSKSLEWNKVYQDRVVTGAVIAGVFDFSCLAYSHHKMNVALFWHHKLDDLLKFVLDTKVPSD